VNASPAAVDEFYRTHTNQFQTAGRVRLRVIVLNRGDSSEAAEARRQEAADIRRQVASGGSFEEVAKAKSSDRSAAKGGDWGWMETGLLRQEIADAARRLERGSVSEVIETGDAFYILKLEDREDEKLMPLEAARPEIERQMEKTEAERLHQQWIRRLRDAAFIRIVQPNLPPNVSP
jgi:parvulin-like peptidyl-prolyl isomerase